LLQSALHDIVVPRARSTRFGCRRCADHNFEQTSTGSAKHGHYTGEQFKHRFKGWLVCVRQEARLICALLTYLHTCCSSRLRTKFCSFSHWSATDSCKPAYGLYRHGFSSTSISLTCCVFLSM